MDKLDLQHRLSVPHNAKANQSFLTSGQRQNNSLLLLKLNKNRNCFCEQLHYYSNASFPGWPVDEVKGE